jgi:hypothetical protein
MAIAPDMKATPWAPSRWFRPWLRQPSHVGYAMSSRLAVAGLCVTLSLVACGQTAPTTPPTTPGPALPTTPVTAPSSSPAASLDAGLPIDDAAYLAGEPFLLPVAEAGGDWVAPSARPLMVDGRPAARVAFLPASCATGDVTILVDGAPDDDWEISLREDGTKSGYTTMIWPSAQVPECASGEGRTYLQVAYRPFVPRAAIHMVASFTNITAAPAAVEVVPVFTAADATQPSLMMNGFVSMGPLPGPEHARSGQQLSATDFTRATLPDGTMPTHWGLEVTGCASTGGKPFVIRARIGGAAPIDIGSCSEGGMSNSRMSMPLPAEGTRVAVLMTGGTTKSLVRVSEFQWRGDRP